MPKHPSTGQPGQHDGPRGPDISPAPEETRASRQAPAGGAPGRPVAERRKQFLIAPLSVPLNGAPSAGGPMAPFAPGATQVPTLQNIERALRGSPDIDIVRTAGTRNVDLASTGQGGYGGVLVARMTDGRARALQQQGGAQLLVERDQHLHRLDPVPRHPALVTSFDAYGGPAFDVRLLVLGKDGAPLPDADVTLFGAMLPAAGRTDAQGMVTLTVHGASPHAIDGVYVKPRADYWSFYLRAPDLATSEANVVALPPLSDWPALQGFPARGAAGWGARAMRLDQLPPGLRGQGIRVP